MKNRIQEAGRKFVVVGEDGQIRFPQSQWLRTFNNPNTVSAYLGALRCLDAVVEAYGINLTERAVYGGEFLSDEELSGIKNACYLPLKDLEGMNPLILKRILVEGEKNANQHKRRVAPIEANTAKARFQAICAFLDFYLDRVIYPKLVSQRVKKDLEWNKNKINLAAKRSKRKKPSPYAIRSLPPEQFLSLMAIAYKHPHQLFSGSGEEARQGLRDRVIFLLACEGLRVGMIGNIRVEDFDQVSGRLRIVDNSKYRKRISTSTMVAKGFQSELVGYEQFNVIQLWPHTCNAIKEYLDGPRADIISTFGEKRTSGFLLLKSTGEPLESRTSMTKVFARFRDAFYRAGNLDIPESDYLLARSGLETYPFDAYVLRHSFASLFYSIKRDTDLLKMRMGWSENSKQPERYALRAKLEEISELRIEKRLNLLSLAAATAEAAND